MSYQALAETLVQSDVLGSAEDWSIGSYQAVQETQVHCGISGRPRATAAWKRLSQTRKRGLVHGTVSVSA